MTRREKLLSLCVGGTLCAAALVTLVRWTVVDPYKAVKEQIAEEQRRRANLTASLKRVAQVEEQWRTLKGRTLAETDDPGVAQRRFREDMHQLLEQHGLSDPIEPKVSPGAFIKYKDDSIGVPLTISATGTLKEIVGFLCDFYRRDYVARLDKVRITADLNVIGDANSTRPRSAARAGRANAGGGKRDQVLGPDGPELKLNISAVTLVLPKLRDVPAEVMGPEIVVGSAGRLLRDRPDYNTVLDKNLFLPHQERVAAVPPPPPRDKTEPAAAPPPPPPPPPDGRDQKFVNATTSLNGEVTAYVIDQQQRDQPPTKYLLDEPFDDGTLVLILPKGVVARVGAKDYFYPLGKSFTDREEVTADAHPEVWEALREAFAGSSADSVAGRTGFRG